MERTMSVEDKIRRAEEIYNRRRGNEYKTTVARVSADKSNDLDNNKLNKKLKKMIIQIIVCMLIYLTFHYVINNNTVFSEDFRKKCEEILSYDISFSKTYEAIANWITTMQEKYHSILLQETQKEEQQQENNTEIIDSTEHQESIGGAEEILQFEENKETQELPQENISENQTQENLQYIEEVLTEEQQMQKDADEIKSKINFIKPLIGTITSRYGLRNPEVSTVSKFHTGIDIAANEGEDIISATNGKVILASSEGAYGNHLGVQIEDVIIIYAHCLSLFVNEGDEVVQGQKIAEVGSTGNSTGPHLHFEIRRENRYINPDLLLEF